MTITASRLSEGNKLFPAEVYIEPNGLTIKFPGMFSGQSKHLDYQQIGEVSIDTPLVGFSSITFFTAGTRVYANGFTSDEVRQIKEAIDNGKTGFATGANAHPIEPQKTGNQIIAEAKAEKIEYELERQQKHDNAQKPWMNDSNFRSKSSISSISFPNDVEDIEKTVEKIIIAGVEEIKKVLGEPNLTILPNDKSFYLPYYEEFDMVEACVEKAQVGIKKLKRTDEKDYPKLKHIILELDESYADLKEKWLPKLIAKRAKKKQTNIIVVIVLIGSCALFFGYMLLKK
jgi:hypothetical protein